ncbi:MAG: nifF [Bacteroidetes bacterium]|nr:nifF [Bacteroidota bacterium]
MFPFGNTCHTGKEDLRETNYKPNFTTDNMKKIALIYGSTTDNTKWIAERIAAKLSAYEVDLIDVARLKAEQLAQYYNLILGTSTWGAGDIQNDWESFLPKLKDVNLSGKVVALFGLGDSYSYADTFVDGMAQLYEAVKDRGCTVVGAVSPDGYVHASSNAVVDGNFVGLPLDQDNESDRTDARIDGWLSEIESLFIG